MNVNGLQNIHESRVDLWQQADCEDDGKCKNESDDEVSANFEITDSEPGTLTVQLEARHLLADGRVEDEDQGAAEDEVDGSGEDRDGIEAVCGRRT